MNPGALIAVFVSFWSITAVGAYLITVALGNLHHHRLASHPQVPRGALVFLRQQAFLSLDVFLLLLGTILAGSGMFFLYMVAYG